MILENENQILVGENKGLSDTKAFYFTIDTSIRDQKNPYIKKTDHIKLDTGISCLCPMGSNMCIGYISGNVSLLNIDSGRNIKIISKPREVSVTVLRLIRENIWVGYADGFLQIYNLISKDLINESHVHKDSITDFAISPNSESIYSSSLDFQIRYWNIFSITSGRTKFLGECGGAIRCLLFFYDILFSGSDDSLIIGWNTLTREREYVLNIHSSPVLCLTISNEYLWSGSSDGTVCIWNLSKIQGVPPNCIHMITNPHEGPVTSLKNVGLKIWSVSEGHIYVWNSSSFELEIHCRLPKEQKNSFNIVETLDQVICSKIWINNMETGDITIIQSEEILPLMKNSKDFSQNGLKSDERDQFIIELVESQKALTNEVQKLRLELAELKSKIGEKVSNEFIKKPKSNNSIKNSKNILPLSNLNKLMSNNNNDNINDDFKKETDTKKLIKHLKITDLFPRYVIVDTNILLKKLNYLQEHVGNRIGSNEVLNKYNFLYFIENNGTKPFPTGFITLSELTDLELEVVKKICNAKEPPFIIPYLSEKNKITTDKEKLQKIINRVRPFHFMPSSASSDTRKIINTFYNSLQISNEKLNTSLPIQTSEDDIGYPSISFFLENIIQNVITGKKRNVQKEEDNFYNSDVLTRKSQILKHDLPKISSSLHEWDSIKNDSRLDNIQTGVIASSSSFKEGTSFLMVNELRYIGKEKYDENNIDIIKRIQKVKRDVLEFVASHSSTQVQACATDLLMSQTSGDNFNTEKNIKKFSSVIYKLVKRLCRLIEKLETDQREEKLSCCMNEINKDIIDPLDNSSNQHLGLVSVISQMHDNQQSIYEHIIQYLLDEGRRIALQYGRLMDALLQRHKPSVRPNISWNDTRRPNYNRFSSFSVDILSSYDGIVDKIHTMEKAFFGTS